MINSNDYGNYTLGQNKIVLSETLLGGGREASAKLATVMSHEGSHYNGNRIEGLAHLAGAETYAFLNNKFTLQADTSFSMEMLAGIMNASQGKWEEAAAVNGSDLEKTINDALQKSGLIGKINDSLEGMASDVESYIDSITNRITNSFFINSPKHFIILF